METLNRPGNEPLVTVSNIIQLLKQDRFLWAGLVAKNPCRTQSNLCFASHDIASEGSENCAHHCFLRAGLVANNPVPHMPQKLDMCLSAIRHDK